MYYDLKKAEHVKDYIVRLTFATGEVFDADLTPFLWGPIFEPIRNDIEYFKNFSVHPELESISWPNKADIAPEVLYDYAKGNNKTSA